MIKIKLRDKIIMYILKISAAGLTARLRKTGPGGRDITDREEKTGGSGVHAKKWLAIITALALLLCGCGAGEAVPASAPSSGAVRSSDGGSYTAPPFREAVFHEELAEKSGECFIDVSALEEGYVAVSAVSDKRLKFQVIKGEETYNYDIASDGTPSVFPLSCGDGEYRFRIMENVSESRYAEKFALTRTVKLIDEFQPFLRPSDYVSYKSDSLCVQKAAELAADADTDIEVVSAIYKYICSNVKYDTKKAETVQSGYLPDPDETLSTGKGICFDYASLAAAMLRSQGIPTREIVGYVSPDGVYHAWNMFYTTETGWVTVKFQANGSEWTRMDATFAAGGASQKYIGDGGNYTDIYRY